MVTGAFAGIALVLLGRMRHARLGSVRAGTNESTEIEESDRRRCDDVVDKYRRLAGEDLIDLATLRRVELLHDVATNVVRASERQSAIRDLVALENAIRAGRTAHSLQVYDDGLV